MIHRANAAAHTHSCETAPHNAPLSRSQPYCECVRLRSSGFLFLKALRSRQRGVVRPRPPLTIGQTNGSLFYGINHINAAIDLRNVTRYRVFDIDDPTTDLLPKYQSNRFLHYLYKFSHRLSQWICVCNRLKSDPTGSRSVPVKLTCDSFPVYFVEHGSTINAAAAFGYQRGFDGSADKQTQQPQQELLG